MFQLGWPWMLAALALPLLIRRAIPPAPPGGGAALRIPFYALASGWSAAARGARALRLAIGAVAFALLVFSAARPQWIGEPVGLPITGRDLLVAIDLSGSMRDRDMLEGRRLVSRLDAVKRVAGDFIERRHGDRVGLILFGSRAYLQTPLTFDLATVRGLLDEAEIGLAGEQTAIGDAIGLAVKRLRERETSNRVLVLLTDGANTTGAVHPIEAAQLAAADGVRVYTIGVGADEATARILGGRRQVAPSTTLDESTLGSIAALTGGHYFRARDPEALASIYTEVDALEPAASDEALFRPVRELFHWPLGAATALTAALWMWWAAAFLSPLRSRLQAPQGVRP